MYKQLSISAFLMLTSVVMGCTPGNNVPGATATGAIAGGLVGNELFHGDGHIPGIIGSSLVGGIIGDQVGQSMDRNQQASSAPASYAPSPYYQPNYSQYRYAAPPPRTYYVYPAY